jgi:medium-chain acyl-[acyl-carrier-protein] hydrolase
MITGPERWVTRPVPNPGASLRLFCLPYAGGGSSIFRAWGETLPTTVDVCPVQLPGRENRFEERPFTNLRDLVETLAHALDPYLDRPFALFGHSMGALIAFELARQLRRESRAAPAHLLVSGFRAPQLPGREDPIHNLPQTEFMDELRELNGTPEEILQVSELMELLLPVLRADFTMVETHTHSPEAPLACPISAYGGLDDRHATRETLAPWRDQTQERFSLELLPGDHFFLRSAVTPLLEAISKLLSSVDGGPWANPSSLALHREVAPLSRAPTF